jgi:UDPglucose--hexose-1-phosphate uridylyltransferase
MSEIRQNIITRDWVIIATERAKRPHEFAQKNKVKVQLPHYKPDCPFCAGNEALGTKERLRIPETGDWNVRIISNKYPALSPEGSKTRTNDGIHKVVSGVGIHDVVVDTPIHNTTTALLPVGDIYNILLAYKLRYQQIMQDKWIESIVIFKNHGESAGSSLEHPHSQITAAPIVSHQFRSRIQEIIRYFDDNGDCVFCRVLLDEIATGSRIIAENNDFLAFIPFAALSPFHIWVFPRNHYSSYSNISETELKSFASILKIVLSKLYFGLGDPDYNYTIRSAPLADRDTKYYHWYLSIIPRISKQAGFELGSGMFINSALPEESAEFLRNVKVDL